MKAVLNENGFAISDCIVQVYNVNPNTGEYVNKTDEFLTQGVGLPAHSYIEAPLPEKLGFAICRGEFGWEYKVDYRNQTAYSIETGEAFNITELGALSDNATIIVPQTKFDKWNGSSWVTDIEAQHQSEINSARDNKNKLESIAKDMIEILSDAIELDMALHDDAFKLKEWRKYRVLLGQVDINSPYDIFWPLLPDK